jgi:hypothetical protein
MWDESWIPNAFTQNIISMKSEVDAEQIIYMFFFQKKNVHLSIC